MSTNILHIGPDFDLASGVTRYLLEVLDGFNSEKKINLHLITNRGDSLYLLKNFNVKLNIIPFQKGKRGIFSFIKFKNRLEKYCIDNKIKIIHTHHRYPELAAYYASKKNEIKTITTVHSFVNGYKRLSFRSDKIIAVSDAVKDQLLNRYSISPGKIETMYNPISIAQRISSDKVNLRKKLQIPGNKIVLLFVGRISREKGVDILLESLSSLKSEFENILLVIVGSEEENILNEHNIVRNHLKVIPPTDNIEKYYGISDIVVLPSRIDSFPYVMLEAGWFTKPFTGTKTGGIAEFIEDGVNGYLCEPGNANELAEKIKFLIEHPHKAKAVAKKLHQKVIEDCNCEKYFEKLIQIYNNLLNDK